MSLPSDLVLAKLAQKPEIFIKFKWMELFLRRVFYPVKSQRSSVRDALQQLRETEIALGPEFITRIKMLVKNVDPESLVRALSPGRPEEEDDDTIGNEAIDQKKNLLIIMKFLQIKQGNKDVQSQVRTLLSDTTTLQ